MVHNLINIQNTKGQIARAAGTFVQITQITSNYVLLKLPSGEYQKYPFKSYATLGRVSNINFKLKKKYKAGQNR